VSFWFLVSLLEDEVMSDVFAACVFRVEKYRPTKLDDLISHEDIIATSM
jgi:hypothetical protein